MESYKFHHIGSEKRECQKVELYRFRNDFNDFYIVEVFYYKYNVYAIKFYLKKHSLSNNRYNLTYQKKYKKRKNALTGNFNFFKVLNTILLISLEISKKDSKASFGFMGAPKLTEADPKLNAKNINQDCTISDTKRYKVYLLYVKRYFNPLSFEYIDSKTSSILLLRNNRNRANLTTKIAENYIVKEIIPSL